MSEPTLRLLILLGVAVVVAASWWWSRPRRATAHTTVRPDLEPGVILFSSETCSSCRAARKVVVERFGGRHREIRFEDDPPSFGLLGIRRVPTVMIVGSDHRAVVLEGVPSRRQLRKFEGP